MYANKIVRIKRKSPGACSLFLSTGLLIWLDQWTKSLAVQHLMGKPAIVLLPGIFELRYLENRGAALECFRDGRCFSFWWL